MTIAQNIPKFYINRAVAALWFAGPIFVLFLLARGLSMAEVLVLEALYAMAIVGAQVPISALADVVGRKKTIAAGYVLQAAAVGALAIVHNFLFFAIAEVIWGVGVAMTIAQENSLVYDSLRAIREQKRSKKIFASAFMLALLAAFFGSLIGGFIAVSFSYESAFFATAGAFAILCGVSMTFVEPAVYKRARLTWRTYVRQIRGSIAYVARKWDVALLIVASALTTAILTIFYWFIQPYLVSARVDIAVFGAVYAATACVAAAAAMVAPKVRIKVRGLVTGLSAAMTFAFIAMALVHEPSISPLLVLVPSAIWGLAAPTYLNFIHKNIPSPKRATISSLEILVSQVLFAVLGPLLGHISDVSSLQMAFAGLAVLSACAALFFFAQRFRKLKE